jgi:hypothetical protein
MTRRLALAAHLGATLAVLLAGPALAQTKIDNSSIGQPDFREHNTTYGLVFTLPKSVTTLDAKINGPLKEKAAGARP